MLISCTISRAVCACIFLAALTGSVTASSQAVNAPASNSTHFIGGLWFDGQSFTRNDFYAVNGVLTHHAPAHAYQTADLHGGFVVPAFGDAHEHNFDSVGNTPGVVQQYLRDGVFYAQGMTDITTGSAQVVAAHMVNTPTTVDVTYAHGGVTAPQGHPKEIYEQYALGFYEYPLTAEQNAKIAASSLQAGNAYWEIANADALAAAWPKILAAKPDLIKVLITNSEHFADEDPAHMPLGMGLDPRLIPLVVARAHAAHLKVAAHIDTAVDFHNALIGGVDEMAHLPGYYVTARDGVARYHITDADIAEAKRRGVKVIATASIVTNNGPPPAEVVALTRESEVSNLTRLRKAGVPVLIGSDFYNRDTVDEARFLKGLGVWTNLELLRMYSVTTPQDIFPKRHIGELREGFEANFLVLKADPIVDWKAIEQIADRWKQGQQILLTKTP